MKETKKVSLTLDGVATTADAGATIMQAADAIGVRIPRLCYHPNLSILGACLIDMHPPQAEFIRGFIERHS